MEQHETVRRLPLPMAIPALGIPVWAIFLTLVLLALPYLIPLFYVLLMTEIAIVALFAVAMNFLMGFGGMVSFGHAAYFGLGAYGSALLLKKAGVTMLPALIGGPFLAAAGALIFGVFIVRLTAVYFSMLSLAFSQIVFTVLFKWYSFTGGDNGLLGIWPSMFLRSPSAYYYFTMGVVALSIFALHAIVNSPFGYTLKAIRDNSRRAQFIGINVKRHQLMAFVISGFFSGMAGSLFAFFNGSVFPDFAHFNKSFEPIVVTLMGGTHSFFGPIIGSLGFKVLETLISRQWPVYWPLVMGSILVGIVLLFPRGFMGFIEERPWRRWLWRKK
ncbi:MAG: branched-chain amino acid ABC transporter permease [Candidatus Tectomicrobia bacterium]|nr:branched-chain amino acid ABC transporter permease [Candidatus Tectomicrobia bacterium]